MIQSWHYDFEKCTGTHELPIKHVKEIVWNSTLFQFCISLNFIKINIFTEIEKFGIETLTKSNDLPNWDSKKVYQQMYKSSEISQNGVEWIDEGIPYTFYEQKFNKTECVAFAKIISLNDAWQRNSLALHHIFSFTTWIKEYLPKFPDGGIDFM